MPTSYPNMDFPAYPMRPCNGGDLLHRINETRYQCDTGQVQGWRFEPKFNGWRALVNDRTLSMFNRHAQRMSITSEFTAALAKLQEWGGENPWWDVEALERRHDIGKGSLIMLDNLISDVRYIERRDLMEGGGHVANTFEPFNWRTTPFEMQEDTLYTVPSFDYAEAVKFWVEAQVVNELLGCTFFEGVVAKRMSSHYKFQLRSDNDESMDWIKHRFTTAA